ncbi:MAG: hypothetical protein R2712_24660 [Vicinamibacterales bacterium]
MSSEFRESPGLRLTLEQAQRLWNLDPVRCEALLSSLVDVRFLTRTPSGAYVRSESR